MATYYVDYTNGNDANNGLGPDASHASNKPWKTIGKLLGASGMASGDTAYLAPGTFREVVTVNMTSATAETLLIADPQNAQGFKTSGGVRVAAGEVRWSVYTTNDTTAPSASSLLTLNGRDYLTFRGIVFALGGNSDGINATTTHSTNCKFEDCYFLALGGSNAQLVNFTGIADTAANWTFDRCVFIHHGTNAGTRWTLPTSASADYDVNVLFRNCLLLTSAGGSAVFVLASGAGAFKAGGVDVLNCTALFGSRFMQTNSANLSTSIPCTVNNCLLISLALSNAALDANTSGQITEDYNIIMAGTPRTNVSAGANSISNYSKAVNVHVGQELAWGGMLRPFLSPMSFSPLLGFGGASPPSVDMLNRVRPAGGASTSTAVGALERHDTATQETTTVDAGSSAARVVAGGGPGDQDLLIPVDASSTTITVRMRYDTNHATTNKPQAQLLANGEIGFAGETKTMTAAVDTWETLTFSSFTPSAKGFVTLRLISRSAAGNGIAYFDTVTGGAQGSQGMDYFRAGEPLPAAVAAGTGGGPVGNNLRGGFCN